MYESDHLDEPLERFDGPTVSGSTATFQGLKRVFQRGEERQRAAARMLLIRSGVWMPIDVYRHWPVLLPWVIRRNQLKNHEKGRASAESGLRLEDNAPVGRLKTNLPVSWGGQLAETFKSKPLKSGGTEWMQSHCWSGLAADPTRSTSTHPLTNSFVPNLVWLPHAIGRLTDDEALIFKDELRAIAWARYRHVAVAPAFAHIAEQAWNLLGEPQTCTVPSEELELVNEFQVGAKFYDDRLKHFSRVWGAVNALLDGSGLDGLDLTPKTYRDSLPTIPHSAKLALRDHLEPFAHSARLFEMPDSATTTVLGKQSTHAKPPTATPGKTATTYTVTTPTGTFPGLARSRAALRIVRALLEAGVDPGAVKGLLLGKLRNVPGSLAGGVLWDAMQASGVTGPKGNWFVGDPIHVDQQTWVLNANAWNETYAHKTFPMLCALSGGAVSFSVP